MKLKIANALTLALIMAMLITSVGLADNVINDVVAGGNDTITAGGSTVINYQIKNTNSNNSPDPQNSCNPADATPATVTINTPAGVTVDTSGAPGNQVTLTFTSCETNKPATFSSSTPGHYTITVSVSDNGTGTYNTTPAIFTLHVNAPADTTPPVINYTLSPSLPDGSNGWYKSNVTLTWTVTDPESTVTKTGCINQNITSDQAATTYSCSASSAGGFAAQVDVTIKRDATAPSISGSAAPTPNGAGWNNTNVNVTFSCSDGLSGIASCGPNQTLTGNGNDQSATGNAVDNAGNSASATVSNIDIDKELPTINASVPAANGNGWYKEPVTAIFSCSDAYSGIDFCEPEHAFTGEGSGLSYTGHASDVADNENSTNVSVNIDSTAPVIALVSRTPANSNGWNNGDVALEWSCTDGGAGVVAATINKVVSAEGAGQSQSATCEDLAGNTSSDEQTDINIDKTAPSISAGRTPAANANGWNNTDVTASYDASDTLSGLASPATGSFVFNTEGAGQSHTFTVTDLAGNSGSATVDNVNIDKTAPTLSGVATTAPNSNGWYNADVAIHWTCSDAGSGLDGSCPSDSTITGEGDNLSASASVSDLAGNSATATVSGIKIDRTAPTITGAPDRVPNGNGWYNADVTVSFTCDDALSGVSTCSGPSTLSEGANQSATGTATDLAGNSASTTVSGINIDKTAPTITFVGPSTSLWYTTDVIASWGCSDALSGVVSASVSATTSGEGTTQPVTGTCADNAGNSASDTQSFKVDKTKPTLTWNGGPSNGGVYYFGFVPAAPTCTAADTLSGPNGCDVTGYGNTIGSYTMTAKAFDVAGNSYSETRSYTVNAWKLQGFYQPVDMGKLNIAKNGSTVPLKFEVFAGDAELTSTNLILGTFVQKLTCGTGTPTDDIENYATGGTSLRYDTSGGQFIFNWQTPKFAGNCYRVTLTTADGSKIEADFKLK